MKVLSLFDGMSCGQIALNRLGIKVDKYYASEIDKYAIKVTQANFPETIQIGDVCDIKAEDYQDVDLIMAGSPCQGFSFAGKQLAFDDPRSALFFEFIRLLKEIKPKYFLLENVKMKKEYLQVISEQVSACYPEIPFGIEPIFINSSLVSAQSRQRYYWTNIPNITQPEERGIVLRDILDDGFDTEKEKSYCIDANYYKGASVEQYKKKSRRQLVFKTTPEHIGTAVDVNGHDILKRVYSPDGKSPTVNTCQGGNREPKVVEGAWRGRYNEDGSTSQKLELRKDEKSNAITTVQKDSFVVQSYREVRTEEAKKARKENRQKTGKDHTPFRAKELQPRDDGKVGTVTPTLNNDHRISLTKMVVTTKPNQVNPSKDASGKQPYMQDRVFDERGKSHALTASFASRTNVATDIYWRKLTPLECERLQTVPDNYTNHVSNTQRYKMLGNGWTVEVICHILKNMEIDYG